MVTFFMINELIKAKQFHSILRGSNDEINDFQYIYPTTLRTIGSFLYTRRTTDNFAYFADDPYETLWYKFATKLQNYLRSAPIDYDFFLDQKLSS